jgi:hypothetical protein
MQYLKECMEDEDNAELSEPYAKDLCFKEMNEYFLRNGWITPTQYNARMFREEKVSCNRDNGKWDAEKAVCDYGR